MLTDFIAQPRWQESFTLETTDPDVIIPRTEHLIETALRYNADHDAMKPLGIGLGIVGLVDAAEGVLKKATNLGWEGVPFRVRWEERFHLSVHVGNEASIATLGENYFGAAQGYSDFVYLKITRNAIGAGVFVNGTLYHGTDGYAGEAGHMVIDFSGPMCTCGSRGCWEAVLREALAPAEDVAALIAGAQRDDPQARRVLAHVIEVISVGIASLINLFNPQMIVLGGTVGQTLAPVLAEIQQQVAPRTIIPEAHSVKLVTSQITSNACALGAVALVLDDILGEPAR
jgi:predicted NBD/HSP70 family sugar kinase